MRAFFRPSFVAEQHVDDRKAARAAVVELAELLAAGYVEAIQVAPAEVAEAGMSGEKSTATGVTYDANPARYH